MLDKNIVNGFNVNTQTTKPDCIACTEAKQFVEPFDQHVEKETEPGDLTHNDLWEKYDVASIHGNHYYLLMVDDSSRYVSTEFLKEKKEATQKVKNYLAQLISHNRKPKAIRIDRGKEFLNINLTDWCQGRGIEIQMMAPYSPSQNGVAERMNRTLVELACAMIRDLPKFLWEYAVAHSTYLRNRTYTKSLKDKTPYEKWLKRNQMYLTSENSEHRCGSSFKAKISLKRWKQNQGDVYLSALMMEQKLSNILMPQCARFLPLEISVS